MISLLFSEFFCNFAPENNRMRKIIYIIASIIMIVSCDIRTSDNGDLDGYWQLRSVDTLATGGSCDTRDSLLFWSFQVHLLHVRDNSNTDLYPILMRFNITGNQMTLTNPIIDLRDSSDLVLEDYEILKHYGIHDMPEKMTITTLNSSKMVLENRVVRLNFRKY